MIGQGLLASTRIRQYTGGLIGLRVLALTFGRSDEGM